MTSSPERAAVGGSVEGVGGAAQGMPPVLSKSTSEPVITPAVPLLLNPELMKGTNIQIVSPQVSPQVHVSIWDTIFVYGMVDAQPFWRGPLHVTCGNSLLVHTEG